MSLPEERDKSISLGGDTYWMAPEMLKVWNRFRNIPIHSYSSKLDVFSLGLITLYAIDRDFYRKQKGQLNVDPSLLETYFNDVMERGLITDNEFIPILKKMLSFDIASRISLEDLYYWMVST